MNLSDLLAILDAIARGTSSGNPASQLLSSGSSPLARLLAPSELSLASPAESVIRSASGNDSSLGGVLGLFAGPSLIFSAISSLFGGGEDAAPELAPLIADNGSSLRIEAGFDAAANSRFTLDSNQLGLPRASQTSSGAMSPTVIVNVNAIDSRSFADHSDEIAAAVRQALLTSHPLNALV